MKSIVVSIAAGWVVAPPSAPVVRAPYVRYGPLASAGPAPRDFRTQQPVLASVREPLGPVLQPFELPVVAPPVSARPASSANLAALCALGALVGFGMGRRATLAVAAGEVSAVAGPALEFEPETAPIVERYLEKKYQLAASDGEPTATSLRSAFSDLLPPLPEAIYKQELEKAMKPLPEGKVTLEDFKACALGISDWRTAGTLTVCEVIYIDALANYYSFGRSLLADEDYNELKKYLYGEGSSLPQLSMDEAKFVTAVYRYHRGDVIMEEPVYAALKKKLQDAGSWVVKREKTPNELLGLRSFMYYLHLGLEADAENWKIPTSLRVVRSGGAAFLGTPGIGSKKLPAEIKEDSAGFSLEQWFQDQFKNKTLLMKTYDPFWYNFIPQEEESAGPKKGKQAKDGPFSWLVRLGAAVLGQKTFNKVRGKLIAKHSQVITKFVSNMELSSNTRGNLIKVAKQNGDELGFLV